MTSRIEVQSVWRHQALARTLRLLCENGAYAVGDFLPPERNIAEEYGVSRATVREALRALESQGMIVRRQGSGTQVVATSPQRFSQSIDSLDTLLTYPPDTFVRVDAVAPAGDDPALGAEFGARVTAGWLSVTLRRYISGSSLPISLSQVMFPGAYADVVDAIDGSETPIFALIERRFDVRATDVRLRIDATAVIAPFAEPLQVAPGSSAIRIIRAYRNASGAPLQLAVSTHPEGRYAFEFALRRG
ncbi:transcriptional regulator, GntR family [Rubrimonas cliftonensis]|uniref:Transcriptional regulator, GntR family n=2 Tax=Rubrimonas cliftonensis TaxID=89524 RepID=A0A1H4ATU9_9RHOB|nr:transcriptional regulator, GntR family [Rubrimonas cliftonensis]